MHFIKGVIVCVCCCHACLLYCLCVCSHKSLFSLLFPSIKTSLQKSSLTAAPHIPQSLLPTPPLYPPCAPPRLPSILRAEITVCVCGGIVGNPCLPLICCICPSCSSLSFSHSATVLGGFRLSLFWCSLNETAAHVIFVFAFPNYI